MQIRKFSCLSVVLAAGAAASGFAPAHAEVQIKIGTVQSFGAVVTYIAKDKGYFKQEGIEVDINFVNSAANAIALLAKNEIQVVEGGVSVGYFNGLEQNLPMIMTSDRVSTPIHHKLLVATRLKGKVTKVTDLRGMNVGSNSIAAVTTYELGKLLQKSGMKLDDVEVKQLGFPQMAPALKNGALDATLQIPPFAADIVDQGLAFEIASVDDSVEPKPMTIAASFVNTDWAKANKDVMRGFFVAYIKATREYCQAYHNGANRKEVMEIALKNGLDKSIADIEKNPWTGRNLNGAANMASVMDQQEWYKSLGMVKQTAPAEKVYTTEYIDYANQKLGPAPAMNPESKLPGCR